MNSSLRFTPAHRLNTAESFSAVFDKGIRVHLKVGMYLILPNQQAFARLGMVIAKKKLRLSVQRNYLKRITREAFRLSQPTFDGYDIVFVASHKGAQLCQSELFKSVQEDWRLLAKRCAR